MRVTLASILVRDQAQALAFYTEVLGFEPHTDVPAGEYRWITVVSPEDPEGVQLVLEPLGFAPAATYQQALYQAGIPCTSLGVSDVRAEYARLMALGVRFAAEPQETPFGWTAQLDDTCGNWIMLHELGKAF
ncbi:MAG: VOC family protein [Anaerolineae bacterium]|jgi:predicted enzyme related to lactoylglutathione lyase|nr:VOC family protein [Chloroflexota bacterium]